MQGLSGQTALVTGSGKGTGRAICRRLVEEGVTAVATDTDEAREGVEAFLEIRKPDFRK